MDQEDGAAILELALLLPVLVLTVGSMVSYVFWAQQAMQVQDAAAAAAAYGAIQGNATDSATMTAIANYCATGTVNGSSAFSVQPTNYYSCSSGGAHVSGSSSCSGGTAPTHYVQVNTSSTPSAVWSFPGIPSSLTVSGLSIYRVSP
jgi:Flp pilus assembly protein TadG